MITEKIEVEDEVLASGGFSDVRIGKYKGHLVAVKTMRLAEQDDILKIRKVSAGSCFLGSPDHPPAILQRSRSLEHIVPPECFEACWGSGGHGERTIHHGVRVDGAWKHHAVHQK